jgi:hypothetical protein
MRFSLFSLFWPEIISERPLVFGGKPGLRSERQPEITASHPLFFAVFPLFFLREQRAYAAGHCLPIAFGNDARCGLHLVQIS